MTAINRYNYHIPLCFKQLKECKSKEINNNLISKQVWYEKLNVRGQICTISMIEYQKKPGEPIHQRRYSVEELGVDNLTNSELEKLIQRIDLHRNRCKPCPICVIL